MNTAGNHLTGIGAAALRNNTTASFNTAIGADALRENDYRRRTTRPLVPMRSRKTPAPSKTRRLGLVRY